MVERSLKGMSIGAKSLESDDNVDFADRKDVAYVCADGHKTIIPLAAEADAPAQWECRCGKIAYNEEDSDAKKNFDGKPVRTHWDMLLERRSEEELKKLLEKRLQMHREGWFPDYE